jgi:hypothetical protein
MRNHLIRRFSCPNPPDAEESGQALSIVYFLKFPQSTVFVLKKRSMHPAAKGHMKMTDKRESGRYPHVQ